jgi:hypothetical protein
MKHIKTAKKVIYLGYGYEKIAWEKMGEKIPKS